MQVKFRADESLVEEFDAAIEEPRSEALREYMRSVVEDDGLEGVEREKPADAKLRRAYEWLQKRADDRGVVRGPNVVPGLASHIGISEEMVKRNRLDALKRKGWIDAKGGVIYVRDGRKEVPA